MRLRVFSLICGLVTSVCSNHLCHGATPKPNFVVILADDLGYGDLGCYGHPSIRTPNLDRMAAEGLRFTDFYSSAEVCTPSRAGLLTGRYAVRSGMCSDSKRVLSVRSRGGLPASETTIAEALKTQGYATAHLGKWHLGTQPEHHPNRRGFDYHFGLPYSNDMATHTNVPKSEVASLTPRNEFFDVPLRRNAEVLEPVADQTQLTRRYTEEAVKFIHGNRSKPFFIYFAHTFPHVPLFASSQFKGRSQRGIYGDVVEELDWSVGEVLAALRKEKLDRNTLVVFTSDNGPWLTQKLAGGSAGLLKDGKGSTWEGGMRVPGIAWWPGKVKAGGVTHAVACNIDLYPTLMSLSGTVVPKDRLLDGVDLTPLLLGKSDKGRDDLFYYRGTQLFAVRSGQFKLHYLTRAGYGPEPAKKHEPPLLFDLAADPSEQYDVANKYPDVVAQIVSRVEKHRAGLVPVKSQLE